MRRTHRAVHRRLWPILALLVGIALALALVMRAPPPPPAPSPSTAIEGHR